MRTTGAELLTTILADAGVSVVSGIPGHTITDLALAVGARDDAFTRSRVFVDGMGQVVARIAERNGYLRYLIS